MIVCAKCGHENAEGRQFCEKCDEYLVWRGKSVSATTASLVPAQVTVTPGGEATAQLRIINRGAIVDKFSFDLPAELSEWTTVEPPSLNLYPGASGSAAIRFGPPRSPEVRAGPMPFSIKARSEVNPDTSTEVTGTVTVEPFLDLAGRLVPNTSRSTGTAEHQLKVGNGGNAPAEITISVTNPDDLLTFRLESEKVTVQPGEGTSLKLQVTPGGAQQIPQGAPQPFRVTLAAPGTPPVTLDGAYTRITRFELDGKLEPEASRSVGAAQHWVTVTNTGNSAAPVTLSASDPGQLLTFEITPSNLVVEAGGSARSQVSVALRQQGDRHNGGGQPRGMALPFQVLARAGDARPLELNGTYTPLFVEMTATLDPRISHDPETGRHSLIVANNGNRPATVWIKATDPEEALNITVKPPSITIPAGQGARATVWVGLREGASPGSGYHPFELRLTSDGSTPVKVDGAFDFLFAQLSGELGEPTSEGIGTGHQWVYVTNSGKLPLQASLSATDPHNVFTFRLDPAWVSLEPGQTAQVHLWLTLRWFTLWMQSRRNPEYRPFQVHITAQAMLRSGQVEEIAPVAVEPVTVEGTRAQYRAPRQQRRWPGMLLRAFIACAFLAIGAVVALNTTQMERTISSPDGATTVRLPFVSLAAAAFGVLGFITFSPKRNWVIAAIVLGACAFGIYLLGTHNQQIFRL